MSLYRTTLDKQHDQHVLRPIRRVAARVLLRPRRAVQGLLACAYIEVEDATMGRLEADAERLAGQFNEGEPYWSLRT